MADKKKKNKAGKPGFFDYLLLLAFIGLSVTIMVLVKKMNLLPNTLFLIVVFGLIFVFLLLLLMAFMSKQSRFVERIVSVLLVISLVVGVSVTSKMYKTFQDVSKQEGDVTVCLYANNDSSFVSLGDLEGTRVGYQTLLGTGNIQKALNDANQDIWFGYTRAYNNYLDLIQGLYNNEVDCILVEKSLLNTIDDYSEEEGDEALPVFTKNAKCIYSYSFDEQKDIEASKEEEETISSNLTSEPFCIYLSGVDSRSGNLDKGNSDTNLIAVVNPTTHCVLLLSTPRDFYVDFIIPGKTPWKDKLTHAGNFGTSGVMSTLGNLYGIENLQNYAKINFTGITDLVDALGGITVENPYEFTSYWSHVNFKEGLLHLDGENALIYARERYNLPTGDRARGEHQMIIIKAILTKVLTNPSVLLNYSELFNVVGKNFNTNVSVTDIGSLVQLELNGFPQWKVYSYAPSGSDSTGVCPTYSSTKKLYVMEPDWSMVDKAKQYVQIIMSGDEITDLTPTIIG